MFLSQDVCEPFSKNLNVDYMVLIAFSSVYTSANEFYSFSWLLLIFSSSFLRESALLFISSLNSFSIFTISL